MYFPYSNIYRLICIIMQIFSSTGRKSISGEGILGYFDWYLGFLVCLCSYKSLTNSPKFIFLRQNSDYVFLYSVSFISPPLCCLFPPSLLCFCKPHKAGLCCACCPSPAPVFLSFLFPFRGTIL